MKNAAILQWKRDARQMPERLGRLKRLKRLIKMKRLERLKPLKRLIKMTPVWTHNVQSNSR